MYLIVHREEGWLIVRFDSRLDEVTGSYPTFVDAVLTCFAHGVRWVPGLSSDCGRWVYGACRDLIAAVYLQAYYDLKRGQPRWRLDAERFVNSSSALEFSRWADLQEAVSILREKIGDDGLWE